jgi:hypothetical protein
LAEKPNLDAEGVGYAQFCPATPWLDNPLGALPSGLTGGNLDAIVAAHQDTILGSSQVGYAHGEPNADRQQGHSEREGRNICQHAMAEVVRLFPQPLVAGKIIRNLELANSVGRICPKARCRNLAARPELQHTMLIVRGERNNGPLGFHGCRLRETAGFFSTHTLPLP